MANFQPIVGSLSTHNRGKSARRTAHRALSEVLESRLLMSANWTGPNPTQITSYDLGTVQGNVDPSTLAISQSGEQDWFKFTIGVGGFTSISLNDPSGHAQGHLIAPSGSVLDFNANHTVLDSAPAGSVYYLGKLQVPPASWHHRTRLRSAPQEHRYHHPRPR